MSLINKFCSISKNLEDKLSSFKSLKKTKAILQLFSAIESYSENSEIRYVGGCVRKALNNEVIDDIDLAVNFKRNECIEALNKNNIKFYEIGIKHGTITAIIGNHKFEITSLRKDLNTDGRHAEVLFSKDWHEDASRRDFTINSIYSDIEGNLFDPFNGKEDLGKGLVKFIGKPEKRIQEDYLRIFRYLRFFLNYSYHKHDPQIIRVIKKNLDGVSNLSKERLLDELKKYVKSHILTKLSKDKFSVELFEVIFPQIKKIKLFSNPNSFAKTKLKEANFIFLLSLFIIDGSDNTDYFIYKFNISKKDQRRLKIIDRFYKEKITSKSFSEKNLNKFFYYNGKEAVIDILSYRLFFLKKVDKKLFNFIDLFKSKILPTMPVGAKTLMEKYNIPEGENLGNKLRMIEEEWANNNFQLSTKQINRIINC